MTYDQMWLYHTKECTIYVTNKTMDPEVFQALSFNFTPFKAQLCKQTVIFQDLSLSVMGILNDATGTLMSCAHKDPNCRVGVIIGELMMIPALS